MDTAANKQLLRQVYDEISRGNVAPLLEALADDVEWTIIGSTALSGTSRGKTEVVEKLLKPLRARLADGPVRFTIERLIGEGEHVVMQARGEATAKSGKPYNNTYCIVCRITDGRIREMIDYIDTELITTALGA